VAEQRDRGEHTPALPEHEHCVEHVKPCAAVGLVDQEARPARLRRGRPQIDGRAAAVERLSRFLQRLEPRQRAAGCLAQQHLLV